MAHGEDRAYNICNMSEPKPPPGAVPPARARVRVAEPAHLCGLQRETRALCRSAGFEESAVYQAVSFVTELAYRLHLERSGPVDIELSVVRHKDALELLAENTGPAELAPLRVSWPFPKPAGRPRGRALHE